MRRVEQSDTYHATHAPKQPNRRSFMRRSVAVIVAAQGAVHATIVELAQPKEDAPSTPPPRTFGGVLRVLQETVGYDVQFRIVDAENNQQHEHYNSSDVNAATMAWGALQHAGSVDVWKAADYITHYRLSTEQQAVTDPEVFDCNDSANRVCELLSKRGMPMYLISIWPQDNDLRFEKPWHQMAACKLNETCYLIIDNGQSVTIWRGPLRAYIAQYDKHISMETVWHVGISRYQEPKYDNAVSKLLLQSYCAVESEEQMESLNIQLPAPRGGLLA